MREFVRKALAVTVMIVMGAIGAGAQVQTGVISVKAVDDQGAVMPGASVSITSPVLPRAIEGHNRLQRRVPGPGPVARQLHGQD